MNRYKACIFISLLIGLTLFTSCRKHQLKLNGCSEGIKIEPSNYNSDSVDFYFPVAFTPTGDAINDYFFYDLEQSFQALK